MSEDQNLELDLETRIAIVEAGLLVADSMIRQLQWKFDRLAMAIKEDEPPF